MYSLARASGAGGEGRPDWLLVGLGAAEGAGMCSLAPCFHGDRGWEVERWWVGAAGLGRAGLAGSSLLRGQLEVPPGGAAEAGEGRGPGPGEEHTSPPPLPSKPSCSDALHRVRVSVQQSAHLLEHMGNAEHSLKLSLKIIRS